METTKTGTLVTIVNWDKYQATGDECNQVSNQEVTKNQPTGNQQVTTIKNDKNDKNDKNIFIYNDAEKNRKRISLANLKKVLLAEDEYKKLLDKLGQTFANDLINRLDGYKASTGKIYKSDYATILNWSRKEAL